MLCYKNQHTSQSPMIPPISKRPNLLPCLSPSKQKGGSMKPPIRSSTPQGQDPPSSMGYQKIHKTGTPLRPIVSSIGGVTYSTSKELSRILSPLVGKSPHHIHNNQEFIQHLKGISLGSDDVMVSYDVRALFTSVPVQPALEVIKKLLDEDQVLHKRTTMSTKHIMDLLEFCLRSTYFTHKGKFL